MENTQNRSFQERVSLAVRRAAPNLASALGGPLAGAAMELLSNKLFGRSHAEEGEIETKLLTLDSETRESLRGADLEFQKLIADFQIQQEKLDVRDRQNARARQIALKDPTPTVLGLAVIAGFFVTLSLMVLSDVPTKSEPEFSIMLGALATMTAAVVNYFFGSSAGSREKTKIMADQTAGHDGREAM